MRDRMSMLVHGSVYETLLSARLAQLGGNGRVEVIPRSDGVRVYAAFPTGSGEERIAEYTLKPSTLEGWAHITAPPQDFLLLDRLEALLNRVFTNDSQDVVEHSPREGIFLPQTHPLGKYDALLQRAGWYWMRNGSLGIITDGYTVKIFSSDPRGLEEGWNGYTLQKAQFGGMPGSLVETDEQGLAFLSTTAKKLEILLREA